jgi:hypothetical protein
MPKSGRKRVIELSIFILLEIDAIFVMLLSLDIDSVEDILVSSDVELIADIFCSSDIFEVDTVDDIVSI